MEATFGNDGKLVEKGNTVQTAEGLGGVNIKGVNDPKAQSDTTDGPGHDLKIKDTLVTDHGEVRYDLGSNHIATAGDPLTGNNKTAAGNVTTAGREDQKIK
ncbi:hypothetical protein WJX73_005606 [Symbiochloris irregularis]|uniref:Uncharacterized protein n=1 Tax=Symbiochloris irregularis TaxID=706552 RepID=A0AAW1NSF9_9CHLO